MIKLVHTIIADAVERGASDIHFDPGNGDMLAPLPIRRRRLYDSTTIPRRLIAEESCRGSGSCAALDI